MKKRILLLILALLLLLGMAGADADFSRFRGTKIAVQSGSMCDGECRKVIGDVQISYYTTMIDCMLALRAGKVDYWCTDEPIARYLLNENTDLEIVSEPMNSTDIAAVFPKTEKGQALCGQFSAFVESLWADGTMAEIDSVWFGLDEDRKTILDYKALPAVNGTLSMAVDTSALPFSYMKDNLIVGYDVDVAARFCEANGYRLKVVPMNFDGVLPSVQSEKCDFAATCITVTGERAESVLFSSATYKSCNLLVGRKEGVRLSDLEDKTLGVPTGSVQAIQAAERFPDATLLYFTNTVDMLSALRSHKIDAFCEAEAVVRYMMAGTPDLVCLDERLAEGMHTGAVFPKTDRGRALCEEFSAFIREIRENGVYEEIQEVWFGEDEDRRVIPDLRNLPATNGTLRMAADIALVPYAFLKNGEPVGLDIDTAFRFCKEYGYGLEVVTMDFAGIIPSVISGKVDFACSGIAYTEERAESVLFSEPIYEGGSVVAVLKAETAAAEEESLSFWESIAVSFEKTFLREDRWLLFLGGVLTTLLITVLSILFGTVLGFIVFMLCRNGNRAANAITRFCLWLVQGMPMVVLLMVLYYIVFGSMSGVTVAVIGFTLTFGASVFGLLKMGVGTVDAGQYEAAYALGHSGRHTFYRIILPQAIPHVLPAYKGEIVSLIKATSIVGYITVQDLTKIGDIVRSRTYEAFFPLIAVTVIYFLLEGLLGILISRITLNIDPKKRSPEQILKGVRTDDQN